MSRMAFLSQNPTQTEKLARLFGQELRYFSGERKHAFCIALSGELGVGKTFFVTHMARGLGIQRRIQSPTFVIMKRYLITKSLYKNLWHIDCYRLKRTSELKTLGLANILKDPRNIVAIEWAERAKSMLPKDAVWITLAHKLPEMRLLTFRS